MKINTYIQDLREGLAELKADNEQLNQIIAGIPIDRLKEICEAMKLIGKEIYAVLRFEREVKCVEVISVMIYDKNLRVGTWHKSGHYGNVGVDDVFFGDNAKERAEARLKELIK